MTDHRNHTAPIRPYGTDPVCDYIHCVYGMGQAEAGHCPPKNADWRMKDCPVFEMDTVRWRDWS